MGARIGQKRLVLRRTFFKEWRLHRNLTQEQLAELMDTTKSAVSKMENGVTKYNQSALEAWAEALRCEPADLISKRPPSKRRGDEPLSIEEMIRAAPPELQNAVITILTTKGGNSA